MRWVTGLGIGACAVAALTTSCSGGSESSSQAEPTLVPAFTQPAPGATPAPTVPTTTIAATTTTLNMRSVEVPPGAPPLPLYSGDPVVMTEALFEFLCWVDQHPVEAGIVADLYSIPGTDINESQRAEQQRTSEGNLVLQQCLEVLEVAPVNPVPSDPEIVMAEVVTTNPVAVEVDPEGREGTLPTWTRAETIIVWKRQSDGRWLEDNPIFRERT